MLSLVPGAGFAVGLDFGHQHIRVAICDLSGELVAEDFSPAEVDHAPTESLDLAHELVRAALRGAGIVPERVLGVGMGLAAPIHKATGEIATEGILPGWHGIRPAHEMQARLGVAVELENDANVGALGEKVFGAARGVDDLIYVRVSAGIGAGLDPRRTPLPRLRRRRGRDRARPRRSRRADLPVRQPRLPGDDREPARRRGAARAQQRRAGRSRAAARARRRPRTAGARRAVADAGEAVGRALSMLVNVLNPELVVVGGDLAPAGPMLLDPIRAAIERHGVAPAAGAVRVVAGTLGDRAEVLGGGRAHPGPVAARPGHARGEVGRASASGRIYGMAEQRSSHRVVVVGGGFGGLQACLKLARLPVEVTLVDRRNFHLFQPLAYQVATGAVSPAEICYPLRSIFRRRRNVRVVLGEVVDVDLAARRVALRDVALGTAPAALEYDTLIVSGGSQYSYFGHDEWQEHAAELKSLEGALSIRRRILEAFEAAELEPDPEARAALLTFVVVGAGPTGVEMAGQIAEIARDERGDFRSYDPGTARILIVEALDRILTSFPREPLRQGAARAREPRGHRADRRVGRRRRRRAASPCAAPTTAPSASRRGPSSGPRA